MFSCLGFLDFGVERRAKTKINLRHRKNILYTIRPEAPFSKNYNKTHKSRLKYEIKYDSYRPKIAHTKI